MPFDEYDKDRLEEARRTLLKVYEYNYGDPGMRKEIARLRTIISKLNFLLEEVTA